MNLGKKKALATRTLKVGKGRILFVKSRLNEIKEAITRQDIKDLHEEGAILIKEKSGRSKVEKRTRKRGPGKIKKNVNTRKRDYVIMTRKLRSYVAEMKKQGLLSPEEIVDIRKKIRNKIFRSKRHLKEYIGGLRK
ncbi:hypothetical protein ISS08_01845 [Candidatus Pacearchaeota archaeon]|nr:hypothetical protein [Candidatus Pacearchaeota archaeon]